MAVLLVIFTFAVSTFLTERFSRPQTVLYIVHEPTARSLHTRPVPISGGVSILVATTLSVILSSQFYPFNQCLIWISSSGLLIAIVSFIDDCHPISALHRLLIHFIAAYLFLWQSHLWIESVALPGITILLPASLQIGISLLFVVWMINLYNFMDGMDGFAGGMTIFGFSGLAILGSLTDQALFTILNLIVVGATAGFLIFNFPPAKIFMGDTGASSLGFLAAAFSLWGNHEGMFPLWVTFLLFSPFIVDATVTLARRLLRREKIWLPHKSHYYQRLVQLGWGHFRTVLWEYGLMAFCCTSAVIAPLLPIYAQWGLIMIWFFVYLSLIYLVHHLERQANSPSSRRMG